MMKWLIFSITMGYLVVMAIIDGKKKEIPCIPGWFCLAVLIVVQIVAQNEVKEFLFGMIVGLLLWGISKISKGGVGEGDALVYLVTGVALGLWRNMELLMLSLILASFVSLWFLVVKRKGRKYKIPFIPFTAISYGVVFFL